MEAEPYRAFDAEPIEPLYLWHLVPGIVAVWLVAECAGWEPGRLLFLLTKVFP